MEKVDVLLATYNGEKYLKEQIDSILEQTYSDFRLLISDDGSTDDTRKILEEYKNKDSRIQVFFQESNLGVVKNFEFLLKKVESKYYMFSDQDDIWKSEKIEKSLNKIQSDNCDLVYSDLEVVDEEGLEFEVSKKTVKQTRAARSPREKSTCSVPKKKVTSTFTSKVEVFGITLL